MRTRPLNNYRQTHTDPKNVYLQKYKYLVSKFKQMYENSTVSIQSKLV